MSTEQEHEIVAAIRDWLAATSDVEIPPGLSREEARRLARELLAAITAGSVAHDHLEVDGDLKDVLWAAVGELDEKPVCQQTFDQCDRVYQFVSALSVENDPFGERDEILHRVARIGWRSAPGGLEAVLKTRAMIWEHGDESRHREVCQTAEEIPERIRALRRQKTLQVGEIREICARLVKLSSIRPSLVASRASVLLSSLDGCFCGSLDDREHLKTAAALAVAVSSRQMGMWSAAEAAHAAAASAIRRTADRTDLDRVEVEHLALRFVRADFDSVCELAPRLIERLVVPREKVRSRLILGWSLLDLDRPLEARATLEAALREPAMEFEPALRACVLTILGNVFANMGRDADALKSFKSASAILARFPHPLQSASLTGAIGELMGRRGNLREAAVLYAAVRETYRQIGQAQMVAYMSVLLAELLMMLGRGEEAEAELVAALRLIEKFDLRKEGVAAVALLREAIAKRRTDVKTIQMLRDQLRKGLH